MSDTREIRDPFTNDMVKISYRLTDRLRGRYACGPTLPNGDPEFGWREFTTPPVQHEAADEIERLRGALEIIAGRRQPLDNLMSNVDVAVAALNSK